MDREKLTLLLVDIHEYKKGVDDSLKSLEALSGKAPEIDGRVINSSDIEAAYQYETLLANAQDFVKNRRDSLKEAEDALLSFLPKSIVQAMRNEHKAIHATWTQEGPDERKWGPYAAYFSFSGELVVEPFTDFAEWKAKFEARRSRR